MRLHGLRELRLQVQLGLLDYPGGPECPREKEAEAEVEREL